MKRFIFFLLAVGAAVSSYADSWAPPSARAYTSPSGKLVLRVLPGDSQTGKKPLAVILELSADGESYTKKKEFPLVNRRSPVEACISDDAEVFTFDDWGMMGFEHVVVWYAADGKKKSEYSLAQLAEGSYSREDWERVAVNHYRDEKMETARVKLVRYALGYPPPPEEAHLSLKALLIGVVAELKA